MVQSFEHLEEKHTEFTQLVEDDEEFEVEEMWLEECQEMFLEYSHSAADYVEAVDSEKSSGTNNEDNIVLENDVDNDDGVSIGVEQLAIDRSEDSPNNSNLSTDTNDTTNTNVITGINNNSLEEKKKWISSKLNQKQPTIPITIKEELKTNIFLRCNNSTVKKSLNMENSTELEVFKKLRDLKDVF